MGNNKAETRTGREVGIEKGHEGQDNDKRKDKTGQDEAGAEARTA